MGGHSYCSAHDPRILFGLGSWSRVDALEIVWPSGRRQRFTDLAADRYITVSEEEGVLPYEVGPR